MQCVATAEAAGVGGTLLGGEDFEGYNNGERLTGNAMATGAATRPTWGAANGNSTPVDERPRVSTDISRAGTKSLKFVLTDDHSGDAWSEQRMNFQQNLTEWYMRYYIYLLDGTEGLGPKFVHRDAAGADNNKLLRAWDINYNDYNIKIGASTQLVAATPEDPKVICEMASKGSLTNPTMDPFPGSPNQWSKITDTHRGRWIEVKFHVKCATAANNDGEFDFWFDGVQRVARTDLAMYPTDGVNNFYRNAYLMGWGNSGYNPTAFVYIDDFTLSLVDFV